VKVDTSGEMAVASITRNVVLTGIKQVARQRVSPHAMTCIITFPLLDNFPAGFKARMSV
jgi:hypothetical protein